MAVQGVPTSLSKVSFPSYRLHKASGKAVVTLSGRDVYLGVYGSPQSRAEYDRVVAEWLASGRRPPGLAAEAGGPSVAELMLAYWKYAETAYPEKTLVSMRLALRHLRRLYGHTRVADFKPLALKTIQQSLIDARHTKHPEKALYCRRTINHYCADIRHVFKWGVSEGLVPADIWHGLQAVGGLRRGRSLAREAEPIGPVPDAHVEAILPHLTPLVADMVRLQRLVVVPVASAMCRPSTAGVSEVAAASFLKRFRSAVRAAPASKRFSVSSMRSRRAPPRECHQARRATREQSIANSIASDSSKSQDWVFILPVLGIINVAGEWIKMRVGLIDDPRVALAASRLGITIRGF